MWCCLSPWIISLMCCHLLLQRCGGSGERNLRRGSGPILIGQNFGNKRAEIHLESIHTIHVTTCIEGKRGFSEGVGKMVLWEITLGTAYLLGLKRTYRLALKIQRRFICPNYPKIRQIVQRRTRAAFDVALKVHLNIQQRDIEVGRNLGNWILRYLDKMKPSAQIRGTTGAKPLLGGNSSSHMTEQKPNSSSNQKTSSGFKESDRYLFTSSRNTWSRRFPTSGMMMHPGKPVGSTTAYRYLSFYVTEASRFGQGRGQCEGVIRKDIMEWMLQH